MTYLSVFATLYSRLIKKALFLLTLILKKKYKRPLTYFDLYLITPCKYVYRIYNNENPNIKYQRCLFHHPDYMALEQQY